MSNVTAAPVTAAPDAVRIVLFGMPGSGKSSLLGALAQASAAQEKLLGGKLVDQSGGLAELHKQLAEDKNRPTHDEVVAYPVTLEPAKKSASTALDIVLVDCDGRVANDYLRQKKSLADTPAEGSLAHAIVQADTLVLTVDASADDKQLERDFAQFGQFLHLLQDHRGQQAEVSGFPVYLVLTKCDQLAAQGDTPTTWMQRIEERKRQVHDRFQDFLSREETGEPLPFGMIDFHLWATAARRPVVGHPARGEGPYSVAELFRQCFHSARHFHTSRLNASRHLGLVVLSAVSLVGLLLILAFGFYITRPSAELLALENEIRNVLPPQAVKPAERLKEPLDDTAKKLAKIQRHPVFNQVGPPLRDDTLVYAREVEAYLAYNKEFLAKVREPRFAEGEQDLAQIERALEEMPLPSSYDAAWKDTRIGKRRDQYRNDIRRIRVEADAVAAWFSAQKEDGEKLRGEGGLLLAKSTAKERDDWFTRVNDFLDREPPQKKTARLPGTVNVTYASVYSFDQVKTALLEWETTKSSLVDLQRLVGKIKN